MREIKLFDSVALLEDLPEENLWRGQIGAVVEIYDNGKAFEVERKLILIQPREHNKLIEEVNSMRKKMHDGHPNKSQLFDLKHDAGGMVDIEFCVQSLVLEHARTHAPLVENKGNIALLGRAADEGLIERKIAEGAAHGQILLLVHIVASHC